VDPTPIGLLTAAVSVEATVIVFLWRELAAERRLRVEELKQHAKDSTMFLRALGKQPKTPSEPPEDLR
jgi:hypothetical protein